MSAKETDLPPAGPHTPSGIGNARDPQVFLHPGDEVVTEISGLGALRNRVVSRGLGGYQG
ncbi:fumarylacetoacetate hydrolase family protein [Haloechinothrix salitolerans]|uniref:Fumarylacetoacetate hydrolase family protein n=1 Tax=Haloechinothrix salitolerans TaxID=926830 RepID=A0ABW2C101_9PSEU